MITIYTANQAVARLQLDIDEASTGVEVVDAGDGNGFVVRVLEDKSVVALVSGGVFLALVNSDKVGVTEGAKPAEAEKPE